MPVCVWVHIECLRLSSQNKHQPVLGQHLGSGLPTGKGMTSMDNSLREVLLKILCLWGSKIPVTRGNQVLIHNRSQGWVMCQGNPTSKFPESLRLFILSYIFWVDNYRKFKNTLTSESASFSYNIDSISGCQISPITLLPCWCSIMAPRKETETIMQWKAKWIKEGRLIDSFAATAFNLNYLIVTLHPVIFRFTNSLFASPF